jgi:hypothetical protein
MADEERPQLPADMLLLQQRRRRQADRETIAPEPNPQREPIEESEEDRLLEVAESVDQAGQELTPDPASGAGQTAIALFRPLAQVSVATLPWAGAVDHEALQAAIACCPIGQPRRGAGFFERTLPAVVPPALDGVPREAALSVRVGADELAALDLASRRASRQAGLRLVRAAALPNAIVGADRAAAAAAAPALAAYRATALVHAWHAAFGTAAPQELDRERDAAAVRLLSTLRALLGEA